MQTGFCFCVLVVAACQIVTCFGASAVYGTCEREAIPMRLDTDCVNVTCIDHGAEKPMELKIEGCPLIYCESGVERGGPGDPMKIYPECCPNPSCQ